MLAPRMIECLLVLVLLMVTSVLPTGGASCGTSSIRCSSSSKCIRHSDLCDGSRDCPDGEDEEMVWCALYSRHDSYCSRDTVPCGQTYNCHSWTSACARQSSCSPYGPSAEVCETIINDLLPRKKEEPEPETAPLIDIKELVSFMSVANCSIENNAVPTNKTSSCPQLYTSVGSMCIAPLPFAMTWPEARIACQSIAGKLIEVEFVETFAELVQFLVKADFSSNFWIGGFFDIEKEDWAWSSGPKMPRSTPYWAVKYNSTCGPRQSPTLGTLPGCFHYQQTPTSHGAGYCAALQFEYMYFISDEGCFQKKQPLCIH